MWWTANEEGSTFPRFSVCLSFVDSDRERPGRASEHACRRHGRAGRSEPLHVLPFPTRKSRIAWSPTDSLDPTDPTAPQTEHALLTAFITGDAARDAAAQTDAERIAAVREQFAVVDPQAAALDAGHQATIAWANERDTGGGYAVFRPGQLADFWPTIRAGTGRIRFAGEHTEALAGYMESAVRSGHRVAKALGSPPT